RGAASFVSDVAGWRTFKISARRALQRQQLRRRSERRIRFALALIQETSATKEIPRPSPRRLETCSSSSLGFGRLPGDESEWDSAHRSQFLFPADVAEFRRGPAPESHKCDKRAAHNPPQTASQRRRFQQRPGCIVARVRAAVDFLLRDGAI